MILIRTGVERDLPQVFQLVMELAEFERAPHEVTNSVEQMRQDGFGDKPLYGFFVAEEDDKILGISLYYWRYSTWKGKRLYLEDIVVTATARGRGIGKQLFERTMRFSIEQSCTGMKWEALNWNKSAIEFYQNYGAKLDNEWLDFSLEAEQIKKILQ